MFFLCSGLSIIICFWYRQLKSSHHRYSQGRTFCYGSSKSCCFCWKQTQLYAAVGLCMCSFWDRYCLHCLLSLYQLFFIKYLGVQLDYFILGKKLTLSISRKQCRCLSDIPHPGHESRFQEEKIELWSVYIHPLQSCHHLMQTWGIKQTSNLHDKNNSLDHIKCYK